MYNKRGNWFSWALSLNNPHFGMAHPGDVVLYNEPFAVAMRSGTKFQIE